jgi:hypothetical protein
MTVHRRTGRFFWAYAALLCLTAAVSAQASPAADPDRAAAIQLAQAADPADTPQPRELQPRYEPVPPQPKPWYNDSYLFAMTRGVSNSTLVPAAKAPLYLLTVPVDLVLLPFAAIGGLFG